MKLLTVTGGPTWSGNLPLPAADAEVGRVTFTPVGRVVNGTGGTIGEYTAKLVVASDGTLVLRNMEGGAFKFWGGLPLGVDAGDVENVRAPRYKVREEIEVEGRDISQEFIIEPYETATDSGLWNYNTLPLMPERVGDLPLTLKQFQEALGAVESATMDLFDLRAQVEEGLVEVNTEMQQSLADIAQSKTALELAAGTTPLANEAALTGKPAGAYRLLATNEQVMWSGAVITARSPLSASAAQLATVQTDVQGRVRGRYIDPRFFGLHDGSTRYNPSPLLPLIPFGTLRIFNSNLTWRAIETSAGVDDWSVLDPLMDWAAAQGLDVIYCMESAPDFHTDGAPIRRSGLSYTNVAAPLVAPLKAFATRFAAHYAARLPSLKLYVEAWNEINLPQNYQGPAATVQRAREIAQAVYEGVKAAAPTMPVTTPNVTGDGGQNGPGYLEQMLALGAAPYADLVSVHLYNMPNQPEDKLSAVREYRRVMAAYGLGNLELWDTEDNASTWLDTNAGTYNTTAMPDAMQTAYMQRLFLIGLAAGVDRVLLYAPYSKATDNSVNNFSKIFAQVGGTGSDKNDLTPAGVALQALRNDLAGATVQGFSVGADGAHTLTVSRGAQQWAYVWTRDNRVSRVEASGAAAQRRGDGTFDNGGTTITALPAPRRVSLTGALAQAAALQRVPLAYNPMFRQPGTASEAAAGWTLYSGATSAPYTGSDVSIGSTPITITAVNQYGGFRGALPGAVPGEVEIPIRYKCDVGGQWFVFLNSGRSAAKATSPQIFDNYLPATGGEWRDLVIRLPLRGDISADYRVNNIQTVTGQQGIPVYPELTLNIQNQAASGRVPVIVELLDPAQYRAALGNPRRVRLEVSPTLPTIGNWHPSDVVELTDPVGISRYGQRIICKTEGSYGTLDGAPTASLTAGSNVLASSVPLLIGQVVMVAGSALRYTVTTKTTATNYTVNLVADYTIPGGALSLVPPVWQSTAFPVEGDMGSKYGWYVDPATDTLFLRRKNVSTGATTGNILSINLANGNTYLADALLGVAGQYNKVFLIRNAALWQDNNTYLRVKLDGGAGAVTNGAAVLALLRKNPAAGAYAMLAGDTYIDAQGNVTLLSTNTLGSGFTMAVRNALTTPITVSGATGADLIDGAASIAVQAKNTVWLHCTGGAWQVIGDTTKMAAAMANLTAAPTQADFNTLLQRLRDAGLMAP